MGAILALLSALTYGAGDFFGGLTSRKIPTLWLLVIAQTLSAVAMIPVCLAIGGSLTGRDVWLMMLAGLFVAVGLVMLYRGLAVGPMGVVAPLVAVVTAVIPVVWGVAGGDELSAVTGVGIVMALISVGVISRAESDGKPLSGRGVLMALAAGAGFGATFVTFDQTSDNSGLWPAALERGFVAVVALIVVRAMSTPRPQRAELPWKLIVANSGFDAAGTSFFLLASREGMVSVVSVLASLYPVSTVGLAVLVLGERFSRTQLLGVVLAIGAVITIVLG